MKKLLLSFVLIAANFILSAQVGVNTTEPKATLDVVGDPATSTVLDGILAPRLTESQLRAKTYTIAQDGVLVYVTADATPVAGQTENVTTKGYYFFDGDASVLKWTGIAEKAPTVLTDKIVFTAEYAGAALEADGSDNLGFLTSDNAGSANNWMNYYSWENTQTDGGKNDYDIILRFTLPANFVGWETDAIDLDYAATSDADVLASVYAEENPTAIAISSAPSRADENDWTSTTIASDAELSTLVAGSTGIIVLKMTVTDAGSVTTSIVRLGDITLNFTRSN
ncbi:hypothetical protein [Psychroflexus sp. MES1-P1E]|uniref:hypothetical protein n=1 Tax=Psychroflexus sp. MES1-P1E TaxID=2058320 RepID=UPI000C7B6F56|nr:hypothetical protein [Psychroflexus sp. MES1-P1E]PKG43977.1 hypothetical protein CXF67_02135 [Psychroflexus sp. MES1-P1E]